jgi:Lrp/AsnC family transcriptional regulator of lysine biosynthesis
MVESELDKLDHMILKHLRENSRVPYTTIAEFLGISESTIRNRVRKMIDSGIIKRFTIDTVEGGVKAIILIEVSVSTPSPQIAENISTMKGVELVFETSGQYDISAILSGPDISSLNRSIDDVRNLKGITNTNSLIVLKSW